MTQHIHEGAARYQPGHHGNNSPVPSATQALANPQQLLTEHIDLWTSAVRHKSTAGRGSNRKLELAGINKLRELILELAVRGKLVPQNPDDEPASELLKRIEAEKAQLIKDGKLKKQKPLPAVTAEEKPFELPEGWECYRLGELVTKLGSGSTPRGGQNAYVPSGIPFLRSQNVWNDGLKLDDIVYINDETHLRMENTIVYPGDILLNITGASLGRSIVFPNEIAEANVSQHVTIIRLVSSDMIPFMHLCIKSPLVQSLVWGRQVGMAIEGLSKKVLELFEMPIPPLAEQQRIVAKVDELMVLCDQLEQQSEHQLDAHQQLTETLLSALLNPAAGALTNATSAQELNDNWQRLAQHFDLLFSGPMGAWAIDRLKDTILQLAVMGKLVPQNPDDEPASELLKRIDAEKARLVKEGKIKKQKPLPPVSDDEKPFELPEGWSAVFLEKLAHVFAGCSFKSEDFKQHPGVRVIKISNVGVGQIEPTEDFLPDEFVNDYSQYLVKKNDLVIALTRPYISSGLKVSICDDMYNGSLLNQRVAAIRPYINGMFLYKYLQSEFVLGMYMKRFGNSGLQPNLKMEDVTQLIIPVPPLAEQHRIVAKVDELFALCDQLKERLQHASDTQLNLTDAIVEQALN